MARFVPVIMGVTVDRPDEAGAGQTAETVRAALERLGYRTEIHAVDLDLSILRRLAAQAPVAVFNLVESIRGDGRLGVLACSVLDHLGLPYTGAPTVPYLQSSSKLLTKTVLAAAALPTAALWPETGDARVIVKSVWEHASFGIDQGSVVEAARAGAEIAAREARFGGPFFAEAYIPGREFNLSIVEDAGVPRVLPIAEMCFEALPAGVLPILDYDAKWNENATGYKLMYRRFGVEAEEPALAKRLEAAALACWRAAGLRGYGRVDLRVDPRGEVFILEFNANPCLAPDAGFAVAAESAGLAYDDAIALILAAATAGR